MLKQLDNVDIICRDLDVLVPFYRDVLALPEAHPYRKEQGWAGFKAGSVTLYLIAATPADWGNSGNPAETARAAAPIGELPGLESLAFAVDDLDEAVGWLSGRGARGATEGIRSPRYRYPRFRPPNAPPP